MTALSFIREIFQAARRDSAAARVCTPGRSQRIVNLDEMQLSARLTEEERRQQVLQGHVAEMTERQAGL